jgi:hypothetical protein
MTAETPDTPMTNEEIIDTFTDIGSCSLIIKTIFDNTDHVTFKGARKALVESLVPNIKWLKEHVKDGTATKAHVENCALTHCRNVFYMANQKEIEDAKAKAKVTFKDHEYKYPFIVIDPKYKKAMKNLELKVFAMENGDDWLPELAFIQCIFCSTAVVSLEQTSQPIYFNNRFPFRDGMRVSAEQLINKVFSLIDNEEDVAQVSILFLNEEEKQILRGILQRLL